MNTSPFDEVRANCVSTYMSKAAVDRTVDHSGAEAERIQGARGSESRPTRVRRHRSLEGFDEIAEPAV